MMTHDEIEAAIERLRKLSHGACMYSSLEVVRAVIPDGSWVDGLIDLLRQADPDGWTDERLEEYGLVRLPHDKDGECIHVGDRVYHDSAVQWERGEWEVRSITVSDAYGMCVVCERFGKQRVFDPNFLTHRPPVTVESVLREFLSDSEDAMRKGYDEVPHEVFAEYAKRLRLAKEDE